MEKIHSPGPWKLHDIWICEANGMAIARIVGIEADFHDRDKAEANACLIAAAPELLKALKDIVTYLSTEYPSNCLKVPKQIAKAAISKAVPGV